MKWILALLLGVFAAMSAYWYWAAEGARQRLAAELANVQATYAACSSPAQLRWADIKLVGFPYRAAVEIEAPELEMGGRIWRTDKLRILAVQAELGGIPGMGSRLPTNGVKESPAWRFESPARFSMEEGGQRYEATVFGDRFAVLMMGEGGPGTTRDMRPVRLKLPGEILLQVDRAGASGTRQWQFPLLVTDWIFHSWCDDTHAGKLASILQKQVMGQ